MISWGGTLHAQTTPSTPQDQQPQSQQPAQDTPPAQQDPQTQPAPAPDPSAQQPAPSAQPSQPDQTQGAKTPTSDSQTFSGTVEKSGDKYVLKDDAGHTYDIDHQDEVKKFEGKRVRVQGTLDPSGKKILVK
jgi:outer membrane biosynthesis protein TonB